MNSALKTIIFGILTVLIFTSMFGCGSKRNNFADLINDGDEVRLYEVFGMDCPGCHGGLENLINKVPGVKASKANWEKQQLQVAIEPGAEVSDQAIYDAIKQANFTPGKRLR